MGWRVCEGLIAPSALRGGKAIVRSCCHLKHNDGKGFNVAIVGISFGGALQAALVFQMNGQTDGRIDEPVSGVALKELHCFRMM